MTQSRELLKKMWRKPGVHQRVVLIAAVVISAVATRLALASPTAAPTFEPGSTLRAAQLNEAFQALEAKIGEPFAGTVPAVLGLGQDSVTCGAAPEELRIGTNVLGAVDFSDAYGRVIFTDSGQIDVALGHPNPAICPDGNVCARPVTYFLKSPREQQLSIDIWLDDAGSVYLDGKPVQTNYNMGVVTFTVPAGPFALSFMSCSVNGPSLGLEVRDTFVANPSFGLEVDYDRVFHRKPRRSAELTGQP